MVTCPRGLIFDITDKRRFQAEPRGVLQFIRESMQNRQIGGALQIDHPAALLGLVEVFESDVLERFQNLNVLPRRVVAEFGTTSTFHIQVDIAGLSEERLTLIAAKIEQAPCILSAYWSRG